MSNIKLNKLNKLNMSNNFFDSEESKQENSGNTESSLYNAILKRFNDILKTFKENGIDLTPEEEQALFTSTSKSMRQAKERKDLLGLLCQASQIFLTLNKGKIPAEEVQQVLKFVREAEQRAKITNSFDVEAINYHCSRLYRKQKELEEKYPL